MGRKKKAQQQEAKEEGHFVEALVELLLEVTPGWPTSEDSPGFDSGFRLRISWEFPRPGGAAWIRAAPVLFCFVSSPPDDSLECAQV